MKRNTLLLFLGFLFSFFFAEIISRFYLFGPKGLSPYQISSFNPFWNSHLWYTRPESNLEYELIPNKTTWHKFAFVKTNSCGMNDREYEKTKPPGVTRVGLLGDSFSMATGVAMNESYHALVEESCQNGPLEVLNFSVSTYNLFNYYDMLVERVLPFECDHIVVGFCPYNDFDLEGYNPTVKSECARPPMLNSYFGNIVKRSMHSFLHRSESELYPTQTQVKQCQQILGKIDSVCIANNMSFSVFVVSYEHLASIDSISSVCSRSGVGFSSSHTSFSDDNKQQYWLCRLDHHPNAIAHQIISEAFRKHLSDFTDDRPGSIKVWPSTPESNRSGNR